SPDGNVITTAVNNILCAPQSRRKIFGIEVAPIDRHVAGLAVKVEIKGGSCDVEIPQVCAGSDGRPLVRVSIPGFAGVCVLIALRLLNLDDYNIRLYRNRTIRCAASVIVCSGR